MSHVPRSSARVSAFLASTILVLATLGSSANAAPSPLQSAFSSAAAEFHVPASVLLAVSYTLTRWESSSGAGVSRTTSDGQTIVLASTAVAPDRATTAALQLRAGRDSAADCPPGLDCRFIPAGYQQNSSDPGDYGNYDLATRPSDGLDIRFIVIHDSEVSYDRTIQIFQNSPNYVSAHYVVRSSAGQITQTVHTKNVAWHAGNWNFNMHAIGYEHEGVAIQGTTWYTDKMYQSSAALTRSLAARYGIPVDRAHIIGHDDVPGPYTDLVAGMHWDPGPFWNWARYMQLLGAPIQPTAR